MKIKARVIKVKGNKVLLECNGRPPKEGIIVTIKHGRIRSLKSNALYWLLLNWYIEHGGIKDQGYIDAQELHESLKGRLLCKKVEAKGGFKIIQVGSTADLTMREFSDYMEKCEVLIKEYFGVTASEFWEEYQDSYSSGGE